MTTAERPLRIGSLCSGYGGLDMAVQQVLGGELAWVADPDPGAAAILAHHHPTVPNLGDITAVDWAAVEPVDIACMGFPCQDVSVAGRGAGIAPGTRSGLWAHCAHAISVLRPQIVVIENVEGLLSRWADRGLGPDGTPLDPDGAPGALRAAGAVLGDLASLGFDAEWQVVPASAVGAPHQRKRVIILARPAAASGSGLEARREGRPGGGAAADTTHLGHERDGDTWGRRPGSADGRNAPADASGDGRDEGRPEPARQQRGPDAAQCGGAAPAHADGRGLPRHPQPHREPAGAEADHVHDFADLAGRVLDWGRYAAAIRRWERVLGRPAPAPTEPGRTGQPRLAPAFVEWLMGLAAGHVTAVPGLTRNQQLRALGNGVVPQQGAAALRLLLDRALALDVAA